MDSNFEWQKHRVKERLQEGEVHRLAKEGGNGRASFAFPGLTRHKAAGSALRRLFRLQKRRVYREKSA
ncbi:MAG: hypothetical protein KF770_30035 [Anaerolineae bacterium]|nr:hypothetical protein [Anaerolineae bacterium]